MIFWSRILNCFYWNWLERIWLAHSRCADEKNATKVWLDYKPRQRANPFNWIFIGLVSTQKNVNTPKKLLSQSRCRLTIPNRFQGLLKRGFQMIDKKPKLKKKYLHPYFRSQLFTLLITISSIHIFGFFNSLKCINLSIRSWQMPLQPPPVSKLVHFGQQRSRC